LSQRWIQVSKKVLDQLEKLEAAKKKDRLDLVRSMQFAVKALEMSLVGWKGWVSNPEIMTRFTKEELVNMNKKLFEFSRSFIQYDIEATELGARKGLKPIKRPKKTREPKPQTSYVA
jgi:hypothetical protein